MERVRRLGVPAPGVYLVDQTQRKIYMEYLTDAITVKQFLNALPDFTHPACVKLAEMIAANIAVMH